MTQSLFKGRILIVDDDVSVGSYYKKVLEHAGFEAEIVGDLATMRVRLASLNYDVVLLDLNLGPESGFDGLTTIFKDAPFTKVYVLTGNGSVQRAVDAMRRGASGFFEKGSDVKQLIEDLEAAIEQPVLSDGDLADVGLIGNSPALMDVVNKIKRLRDVDSMVLLLGESGTGKEVLARAIHRLSRRGKERFDAINCGAIPEALLESELFGHRRGAFTDAKNDRKGIFELCSNGTLLLDEIGDMPLSLQMKLLRVLQEHEVTPVGSSTTIKVNTRVIAATHRDILEEARAKRFREDLYFRLSIVVLHIPPLRQRREDIPILVEHFLKIFNKRFERQVRIPSSAVMSRLTAYNWPGNVRELQNAIERSVVLAKNEDIDVKDVFAHLKLDQDRLELNNPAVSFDSVGEEMFDLKLSEAKQAFERLYLERQLSRCHGHVTMVAERAGRYRADVYRLLTRYGIDHVSYRERIEP